MATIKTMQTSEMLRGLDLALRLRYRQSLDEVLHELYIHDVISTVKLDERQVFQVLQTIPMFRDVASEIAGRISERLN